MIIPGSKYCFSEGIFLLRTVSEYLSTSGSVCLSVGLLVGQSVCLSVFLSVGLLVGQSVCLSVFLYFSLSVCRSVCLSVRLSVCLSVGLFVGQSVCRSVSLSVCQSVCRSVGLSVCVAVVGAFLTELLCVDLERCVLCCAVCWCVSRCCVVWCKVSTWVLVVLLHYTETADINLPRVKSGVSFHLKQKQNLSLKLSLRNLIQFHFI